MFLGSPDLDPLDRGGMDPVPDPSIIKHFLSLKNDQNVFSKSMEQKTFLLSSCKSLTKIAGS